MMNKIYIFYNFEIQKFFRIISTLKLAENITRYCPWLLVKLLDVSFHSGITQLKGPAHQTAKDIQHPTCSYVNHSTRY